MTTNPADRHERMIHGFTVEEWSNLTNAQIRRVKCEWCGHTLGSHNGLGYCQTGIKSAKGCPCDH